MNMGMMRIKCHACDGEGSAAVLTAGVSQIHLSSDELREIIPKCEKIAENEPDMQQIVENKDKTKEGLDDIEKEIDEVEVKKKRGRPPINRD